MAAPPPTAATHADLWIGPAAPAVRRAAIDLAAPALSESQRADIAAAVLSPATAVGLVDLWVATRGPRLVGAAWCQPQPGRTAGVAPPQVAGGEPATTAVALLTGIVRAARASGLVLLQALLEFDHGPAFDDFRGAGFQHVADILYLASGREHFPVERPTGPLSFVPYTEPLHERCERAIERSYEHTLDCPRLNGVRTAADVLAGYRATGQFDPARWLLVQAAGSDVGCLILADHAAADQWELVYMGLAPEARGRGWGLAIVRHAQWLAGRAGRARLVLAVDAANAPAIAQYAAAGFAAWDRRSVLIRLLDDERRGV